ncbi:lysine transporter LysE [Devosia limi DSM 17137]|uniref:Lysine transporter LysE n=1 Tax=Devosia limi DSM 17137 TaxID=1121477 RepID=A0A0F5LR06_9HYPH|nr:LysE family transporter [Devosia limi]KKB84092.1 lysine transporter LysE [Devosia limi DSM 17137]SHF91157.1 putative LysE/RhtB family amino acid efflux pump [Devosia limi DSM 17137]
MLELLFAKSFLLGLAVAAPVGPIGALCINRTLERGFWAGVAGGLGTAIADAAFAVLAALGFAAFAALLARINTPLTLIGGVFLIWLGWRGLQPRPLAIAARVGALDLLSTVASTFVLTITNPVTILFFAAMFAGLGLGDNPDALSAGIVVAGVFLGSLAWWFLLSGIVALLRKRLPESFARWVSLISGGVLIAFGMVAIGSVVMQLG